MINVLGINNLKCAKGFRKLLKLNFGDKKEFSKQCYSRFFTILQTKKEPDRRGNFLSGPQFNDSSCFYKILNCYSSNGAVRFKSDGSDKDFLEGSSPTDVKSLDIPKDDILRIINKFYVKQQTRDLSERCGLKGNLFHKAFIAFRRYCAEQEMLPAALVDVLKEAHKDQAESVDGIFLHFLTFSKTQFPHLNYIEELKKFSDLKEPAKWYPEARDKQRKVIYHAGPTNSGKTYHALQRFLTAKSGVYCGPLRLLAVENFKKANASGTPCDLITGEERKCVDESGEPATHQACTVEMTNLSQPYEVAVIDEIQLLRDTTRGWAWTRAFLGVCADEIHVCGEESAVGLVRDLCDATGDEFEVRRYNRLTPLTVLDTAVESFDNVRPGDCIVCFNKSDIFGVCKELESRQIDMAVIYGTLPPATKIANAEKFNDPKDPCKVLVATDAIGMGLNLSIKRMIFYSMSKPSQLEAGKMEVIPTPTALQIAGRAGRFNTQFEGGEVTTFKADDLPVLKELLEAPIQTIQKAGLAPTMEQIELYNLCLPELSLVDTMDIFVKLCEMDNGRYFMCDLGNFKFLAGLLEGVPLQLRHAYAFCCAPVSERQGLACSAFVKFARQFSKGIPTTLDWVCQSIGWPFKTPVTVKDLVHLEEAYDVFDLYHWLSYRFPDLFPHTEPLAQIQAKLEEQIREGVMVIVRKLEEGSAKVQPEAHQGRTGPEDEPPRQPGSKISENFRLARGRREEQDRLRQETLGRLKLVDGTPVSRRLVEEGLVTRRVMRMLMKEIAEDLERKRGQKSGPARRSRSSPPSKPKGS